LDVSDAIEELQRSVVTVQAAVYRFGGSINQLVADDKGTIIVCGWGLAQHAHGDDQVRAVRAALEARAGLRNHPLGASFGLATGEVFTGLLGNERSCAYALIGDVVNVAARLMLAAGRGEILCDLASFEAASARVAFEALPALIVKGRTQAVEVFRPLDAPPDEPVEVVGRTRERAMLRERLDELATRTTGSVVIIEGEPGIGKSRLIADLIQRAVAKGIRAMVASGDAIERSTPYHVWSGLFDRLLGLALFDRDGAERRVMELLESNTRLVPFAPLLNAVLRLHFHETDTSAQVPPRGRALLTRELLIHLFRQSAGGSGALLVLEDAHWLDSSSWALAEALAREAPEVLIVISLRPPGQGEIPAELQRLAEHTGTLRIHLDALTPQEAHTLVCQRLRARALSEPVARLIQDKAEGHPFFAEELAYALRDGGQIVVERGVCRFAGPATLAQSVQVPNTVHVVVTSRIDQLTVEQQLTLKVASIFGRTFDLTALWDVYPIEADARRLHAHVETLVERSLIVRPSPPIAGRYAFKHAIVQEAAYSLLPYALRRQLHAAAAQWYERQDSDAVASLYPLLAHHWSRAESGERATFYLDKAGDDALRRHANAEALHFFGEALELDERTPASVTGPPSVIGRLIVSAREARRLRWLHGLGDAATNLSRWDEGREHFARCLALMAQALPGSDRGFAIGIVRQIGIQCLHRLRPRVFERSSDQESVELLRQAVGAYERIASISYQAGRPLPLVYALISALNVVERLGPTAERALVYADVGNVLGLTRLRRLAGFYNGMAMRSAARLTDLPMAARIRGRAGLFRLSTGAWDTRQDLEDSMALRDQIGDSYLWEENAAARARIALVLGELDRALELGHGVRARAAGNGSVPHEIWGIAIQAWVSRFHGRDQDALDLAATGLRLLAQAGHTDLLAAVDFHGVRALASLDRGDFVGASEAVEHVDRALEASRVGYFCELGISAAIETSLALWEGDSDAGRRQQAAVHARQLGRRLTGFARVNLPSRARAALWEGCTQWLVGRHRRAWAAWRRSLAEAERFALPYEAARAHYEIGRRLKAGDPARRDHLARAAEGFSRIGSNPDLRRVSAAENAGTSAGMGVVD
jgi:hypothetical protein